MHRCRKKGENLPSDPEKAKWQLDLEQFCGKVRISSEWGIKDLKNSWRLFKSQPLPSDDPVKRKAIWKLVMHLNNFRARRMKIGQMATVFLKDKFYSGN